MLRSAPIRLNRFLFPKGQSVSTSMLKRSHDINIPTFHIKDSCFESLLAGAGRYRAGSAVITGTRLEIDELYLVPIIVD